VAHDTGDAHAQFTVLCIAIRGACMDRLGRRRIDRAQFLTI